jgi:hypothetical protein
MYFISLALLVASVPLSKFTMSIFQFSTLYFWLWHGVDTKFLEKYPSRSLFNPAILFRFLGEVITNGFKALIDKFIVFFNNKPAMAISSILLLHVIGLIYTTDFHYALKDLRTKLPIFILPLFIATGPRISTRTFYWILGVLVAAVLGGSLYRLLLFLNMQVADSRSLNAHTSHIRYSLNVVFAVYSIFFFVNAKDLLSKPIKILLSLIAIWLVSFIFYMNYSTGMLLFTIVGFILLIIFTLKLKNKLYKIGILAVIAILISLPAVYVSYIAYKYLNTPTVEFSKLDKSTSEGNSYYHDTVNFRSKNGNWIGLYICDKELRQAWGERSKLSLDSLDEKKQLLRFTLISYLASKDLRKDAKGIRELTDTDIRNIENGFNRFDYTELPKIKTQIEDFIIGFQRYIYLKDPNSGSMIQRFEYWRTSALIISQHPLIGVGTGDVPQSFVDQYIKMNTKLAKQNRLRSHNQYLSITVGLGLIGFAWFFFMMFYPGIKTRNFNNYFYVVYWIIFMASMLTEDTIECQEGVTFYALFTAIMLLGRENAEPSESLFYKEPDKQEKKSGEYAHID